VAFGVILFQPSVKYRRNYSVGDLSSICSKYFSTLEYTDGLGPSVTPSVIIKKYIYFLKKSIEQKKKIIKKNKIV